MESEPLLGVRTTGVSWGSPEVAEKPVASLRYYWPCLSTGICLNTLAVVASVELTKYILDDPTRATYFQTNWWIVWLVALSSFLVALPLYIFTAVVMSVARSVLGPRGAFPSWTVLVALSCANGCVFYGLFNATYPLSFFLQVQVYSVFTAFSLCAYFVVALATSCVPTVGGFSTFGAWLFSLASSIVAYAHMTDVFAYLGYADSRTPGNGLWHPWVAFVLVLLFLSLGAIENAVSIAAAARYFEPESASNLRF